MKIAFGDRVESESVVESRCLASVGRGGTNRFQTHALRSGLKVGLYVAVVLPLLLPISVSSSAQLVATTAPETETEDSEPNDTKKQSGDEPTALPNSIKGLVVDSSDVPIAHAKVTVQIRRFSRNGEGEAPNQPRPWTVLTDNNGVYSITPTGELLLSTDEVRINVLAERFADVATQDHQRQLLTGSFPSIRLVAGRKIHGQLVDSVGNPVKKAIVRFQSNNADFSGMWDSGPFPADKQGVFSVSLPMGAKAVAAIYPSGFAPRFFDITDKADQGEIVLTKGVSLRGRVVDVNGKGVPNTVVGIKKTETRVLFSFLVQIGTAVKTDDAGYFQLPPLLGSYSLWAADAVPDYSRRLRVLGSKPPSILPQTVDIGTADPGDLIILREQK